MKPSYPPPHVDLGRAGGGLRESFGLARVFGDEAGAGPSFDMDDGFDRGWREDVVREDVVRGDDDDLVGFTRVLLGVKRTNL